MNAAVMRVPGEALAEAHEKLAELASKKLEATLLLMGWYFQISKDGEQPIATSGPIYRRNAYRAMKACGPFFWWHAFNIVFLVMALINCVVIVGMITSHPVVNGSVTLGVPEIAALVLLAILVICLLVGYGAACKHDPGEKIVQLAREWKKFVRNMNRLGLFNEVMGYIFPDTDDEASIKRKADQMETGACASDRYHIRSSFCLYLNSKACKAAEAEWACKYAVWKWHKSQMDRVRDLYMQHFIKVDGAIDEVKEMIHKAEVALRKKREQA